MRVWGHCFHNNKTADLDLVIVLSDMGEKSVVHAGAVGSQTLQCWRLQAQEIITPSAGPL